ncbi:MAG: hypothetical protein PHX16_00595 [Syntrophaceticus sp.]|nr:hypothetical protein [Syntrophaceticus sp.]MDD3314318.1 hypothetical protein [Syntrophaceticus sp.]MDD4359285.1 hypothetical protein [Syntrophaceticus sp.]MDD4782133.1 hypothetical protein [Syntrophaceticus sp.]
MSGVRYIEGASLAAGETLRYEYTGHGKKLIYALFFMLFYVILYYVIFKSILEIAGKYREVEKKVKTL